jgi:tRNA-dihydrouridine synthase B
MADTAKIKPNPLKIGTSVVKFPVALAPISGYTDYAFRSLCADHKCGFTYTEAVSARQIIHKSTGALFLLESAKCEKPIAAQILGSNPDHMAKAASEISALGRFDIIDINCGCPAKKVITKGAGAVLMENPKILKTIISAVKSAVSNPITVKIRMGLSPDKMNIVELAQVIEEAGASAISIHARFASNKHDGPADWGVLKKIKSKVSIPIIGNGGIKLANDALRMFSETGVDGVMVGRAALGNPWIFAEIHSLINKKTYSPPTLDDCEKIILEHLKRLIQNIKNDHRNRITHISPEQRASFIFRKHLILYINRFQGGELITRNLQKMTSPEIIIKNVKKIIDMNRLESPV